MVLMGSLSQSVESRAMSKPATTIETIMQRVSLMEEWLAQESVLRKLEDHAHLDRTTAESAYWHCGYHHAMRDFLRLLCPDFIPINSEGTSRPFLMAAQGGENFPAD
jgi:hypothetical protein